MVWAAAIALAVSVGFQGYSLGMTLEDARSQPIVAGSSGTRWLSCTGDSDANTKLDVSQAERNLGVVRCWPVEKVGSSIVRASVPVNSRISATVEYRFAHGRLYSIDTYYDEYHRLDLENGLTAKFGKPTSASDSIVQNKFGAEHPQRQALWQVDGTEIELAAPFLNLKRMAVFYRDQAEASRIQAAIESENLNSLDL